MQSINTIEEWRDVKGFEGSYQVSNLGRVRSLDRYVEYNNHGTFTKLFCKGIILKHQLDHDGYCRINFGTSRNRKTTGIHRLVAEAFIPNPDNLPCVNHIDGNKENNTVENLEWCTVEYNNHHAAAIGLRPHSIYENREAVKKSLSKPVRCRETGTVYPSCIEAERQLGLWSAAVHYAIKLNKPTKQGYTFEYAN